LEFTLKEFLAIDELSQYLGIKKSSLYSMVEKREIPFYKIGRLLRFKKAGIDAWVEALKFEVVSPRREARKIIGRGPLEVGCIVKKSVAQAKAQGYTPKYGRPDEVKDLGKEVSDGAL
jgi:excisionase family DNA binding protein